MYSVMYMLHADLVLVLRTNTCISEGVDKHQREDG